MSTFSLNLMFSVPLVRYLPYLTLPLFLCSHWYFKATFVMDFFWKLSRVSLNFLKSLFLVLRGLIMDLVDISPALL